MAIENALWGHNKEESDQDFRWLSWVSDDWVKV